MHVPRISRARVCFFTLLSRVINSVLSRLKLVITRSLMSDMKCHMRVTGPSIIGNFPRKSSRNPTLVTRQNSTPKLEYFSNTVSQTPWFFGHRSLIRKMKHKAVINTVNEMHWFTVFITAMCVIFLMRILKQLCY